MLAEEGGRDGPRLFMATAERFLSGQIEQKVPAHTEGP